MKIAHLSDTHMGFRAYSKTHISGVNQREIDVMVTFRSVLDSILGHKPDLVIHAGDWFHVVRPGNHSIRHSFRALMQFQEARGGAPFVLCGGNHDSPKNVEAGNIQDLFQEIPGVRFASNMSERFDIPEIDTEILCIPSNSLVTREEVAIRPDLGRKHSVLVVHGMATQALPKAVDLTHADFDVNDLHTHLFTYTALGDYHNFAEYAPNCCFSGSTDYTTTNIWDELDHPKGWVEFSTEVGQLRHVAVPTRKVYDLPAIDAGDMSIEQIIAAMDANAQVEGEPIVRQKISNVHPADRRLLFQGSTYREIVSRCLNYQVVTTPPLRDRGTGEITSEAPAEATTIEGLWEVHAKAISLPAGVDRDEFIGQGLGLLKEAANG